MAAARRKKARDPHPEEELRELENVLRGGLPRGVVLRGEERYFRERGLARVVAAATQAGLELCRHDTQDPEFHLSALLDDLAGGALFATGRCIVVRHADALLTKGARLASPAFAKALAARVGSGAEGTIVLTAGTLRADNPSVKALVAAGGLVVSCRRLWDSPPPWDPNPLKAELVQWLLGRARTMRVDLAPDEAAYVAAAKGNDLFALESELERLRGRGRQAVRELVGWDSGGSPFAIAEQLVSGDAPRALAGLEALFRAGFAGRDGSRTLERGGLVAILASAVGAKVRESVAGAEVLVAGGSPADAAEAAGVRGAPQARQAFEARVRARPPAAWVRMLEDSGALDRRARSGATVDVNDFCVLALRWALRR
jgi:DNA polymerase III delta subunit